MAVGSDPSVSAIQTDAYLRVGVDSPSSTDLTNADDWFQEILDDIWSRQFRDGGTRLKDLENEFLDISIKGVRTLTLPEDFDEEITVRIYDSSSDEDDRGTAQAGASTTITLESGEDITEANAVGRTIIITGGTGVDQYRQITAYDTSTKIATVHSAWDTNPDSTSTYLIVTKTRKLEPVNIRELDEDTSVPTIGVPSQYAIHNRTIVFDRPFDLSTYGIFVRYFMHIHQIDLSESSTARVVRILRNWRNVLVNGLAMKAAEKEDDSKSTIFQRNYERGIPALMIKQSSIYKSFERFTV